MNIFNVSLKTQQDERIKKKSFNGFTAELNKNSDKSRVFITKLDAG